MDIIITFKCFIFKIAYGTISGTQDELMAAIDNAKLNMFDNVPVLMAIANTLSRKNFDFERIKKLYKRVLEIDPKNAMAHGYLSSQYLKRNQTKLAIQHYNKARKLNPEFEIQDEKYMKFVKILNAPTTPNSLEKKIKSLD